MKLLGFFLLLGLQEDWKAAESNPEILKMLNILYKTNETILHTY